MSASRLRSLSFKTNNALPDTERELDKVRSRFLLFFEYGILLVPITDEDRTANGYVLSPEIRHQSEDLLVAVCGSNKLKTGSAPKGKAFKSYKWIWKGVYKWPKAVTLPKFKYPYSVGTGLGEYIWIA